MLLLTWNNFCDISLIKTYLPAHRSVKWMERMRNVDKWLILENIFTNDFVFKKCRTKTWFVYEKHFLTWRNESWNCLALFVYTLRQWRRIWVVFRWCKKACFLFIFCDIKRKICRQKPDNFLTKLNYSHL